jgi:flagellar assembly protein FliH
MALIKSAAAPKVSVFSMQDIEKHARDMLLRARQQADQLLAEAMKEGEALKLKMGEEGRDAGYAAGHAKGLDEGKVAGGEQALIECREELSGLVSALQGAVGDIDSSRRKLEAEALREVVELAIGIARRITLRQGQLDSQVLVESLKEAMKVVVHASDVRVVLNPAQKQSLQDVLPRLQTQWPELKHVELVEDSNVSPGGCRICTAAGEVDAQLDTQLDRIVADLLPAREREPAAQA